MASTIRLALLAALAVGLGACASSTAPPPVTQVPSVAAIPTPPPSAAPSARIVFEMNGTGGKSGYQFSSIFDLQGGTYELQGYTACTLEKALYTSDGKIVAGGTWPIKDLSAGSYYFKVNDFFCKQPWRLRLIQQP